MLKKLLKTGLVSGIAAATLYASFASSANALPLTTTLGSLATTPSVQEVQFQQKPQGFRMYKGKPYYNGHRGYRHRRPGYRKHNGWWFPFAAFALGTIITQGMRQQPAYNWSQAHYNWCYNRYRSYRAYDNTFQPYHGPRKQCRSPYWP